MSIQQLMLGVGAKKKVYMDDVFSTYLYKGNSGSQTINNSIDFSGEGGLLWLKNRDDSSTQNILTDTVRGANEVLYSDASNAEASSNMNQSFNSNGWSMNCSFGDMNQNNKNYTSWSFRKAPGFFDVVTYTGNGTSGRNIAHSLGSVPGCIMVKNLDNIRNWAVYHASVGNGKYLNLNLTSDASTNTDRWNDTTPTSSVFTVGNNADTNGDGIDYVAYVFAGGESEAATARSVEFDASSDLLKTTTSNSDFTMGQGDFTVECWVKPDSFSNTPGLFQISDSSGGLKISDYTKTLSMFFSGSGSLGVFCNSNAKWSTKTLNIGQWHHVAFTRSSGTAYTFIDGELQITEDCSNANSNFDGTYIGIGGYYSNLYLLDGAISNLRVVKGTALYTSSFRPPTEPLTNITNTKLLCCNNSSTTGSTVTPETISTAGNPTASTHSPFDDPAAFTFGDSGKENVIKCGSYVGNGSGTGPEINLGWEPQYILFKNTGASEHWSMFDSMRGLVTGGEDEHLKASSTDAESGNTNWMSLTPTGFKINTTGGEVNNNGDTIIYMAIRRSDGYVGKPVETATDVFAMDTGADVSVIPNFDSGFPVDFAMTRQPASSTQWYVAARLISGKYLHTDENASEQNLSNFTFDSNAGWSKNQNNSSWQSWMWKRHAGFDVVTYKGTANSYPSGVFQSIPHSLGKTPEMIFIKNRGAANNWTVGHNGLNGGTNPWEWYMELNNADVDVSAIAGGNNVVWGNGAPSATHFNVGDFGAVNSSSYNYIAMLFASISGISAVGSYTGNGTSGHAITTGFQPRFVIIKRIDSAQSWMVLDTTRGWGSGSDQYLQLNDSYEQLSHDFGAPTSTGFTLASTSADSFNASSGKYIYYAHA